LRIRCGGRRKNEKISAGKRKEKKKEGFPPASLFAEVERSARPHPQGRKGRKRLPSCTISLYEEGIGKESETLWNEKRGGKEKKNGGSLLCG